MLRVSRQEPASRLNQSIPQFCERFFEGHCLYCQYKNSLLGRLGRARETRLRHGLMTRGAKQATGLQQFFGSAEKTFITPALVLVRSTER